MKTSFRPESVREVMRERGLTIMEFAAEIGISKATVCGYLAGQIAPQIHTLGKMCDRFGRPFEFWLTTWKGESAQKTAAPKRRRKRP